MSAPFVSTRNKLRSLVEIRDLLAETSEKLLVAGRFDPLTLETADWLGALRTKNPGKLLIVYVEEVEGTLLPAHARVLLVAALRTVDLAFTAPPGLFPDAVFADCNSDRQRTASFIQRIIQRHREGVEALHAS